MSSVWLVFKISSVGAVLSQGKIVPSMQLSYLWECANWCLKLKVHNHIGCVTVFCVVFCPEAITWETSQSVSKVHGFGFGEGWDHNLEEFVCQLYSIFENQAVILDNALTITRQSKFYCSNMLKIFPSWQSQISYFLIKWFGWWTICKVWIDCVLCSCL